MAPSSRVRFVREGSGNNLVRNTADSLLHDSTKKNQRYLREWARQELNLRPTDYESAALTAELRALVVKVNWAGKTR